MFATEERVVHAKKLQLGTPANLSANEGPSRGAVTLEREALQPAPVQSPPLSRTLDTPTVSNVSSTINGTNQPDLCFRQFIRGESGKVISDSICCPIEVKAQGPDHTKAKVLRSVKSALAQELLYLCATQEMNGNWLGMIVMDEKFTRLAALKSPVSSMANLLSSHPRFLPETSHAPEFDINEDTLTRADQSLAIQAKSRPRNRVPPVILIETSDTFWGRHGSSAMRLSDLLGDERLGDIFAHSLAYYDNSSPAKMMVESIGLKWQVNRPSVELLCRHVGAVLDQFGEMEFTNKKPLSCISTPSVDLLHNVDDLSKSFVRSLVERDLQYIAYLKRDIDGTFRKYAPKRAKSESRSKPTPSPLSNIPQSSDPFAAREGPNSVVPVLSECSQAQAVSGNEDQDGTRRSKKKKTKIRRWAQKIQDIGPWRRHDDDDNGGPGSSAGRGGSSNPMHPAPAGSNTTAGSAQNTSSSPQSGLASQSSAQNRLGVLEEDGLRGVNCGGLDEPLDSADITHTASHTDASPNRSRKSGQSNTTSYPDTCLITPTHAVFPSGVTGHCQENPQYYNSLRHPDSDDSLRFRYREHKDANYHEFPKSLIPTAPEAVEDILVPSDSVSNTGRDVGSDENTFDQSLPPKLYDTIIMLVTSQQMDRIIDLGCQHRPYDAQFGSDRVQKTRKNGGKEEDWTVS